MYASYKEKCESRGVISKDLEVVEKKRNALASDNIGLNSIDWENVT